jgi:hypothetical protein
MAALLHEVAPRTYGRSTAERLVHLAQQEVEWGDGSGRSVHQFEDGL